MVPGVVGRSRCRRSTLGGVFALACLCLAGATVAQAQRGVRSSEPRKPAWQWTLEERLAKRFDPGAMKARATKEAAEQQTFFKSSPSLAADFPKTGIEDVGSSSDIIRGDKTPELFLTWELFHTLLTRGFSLDKEDQRESRRTIESRAAALGFGNDMWRRLEKAAAPFLKLQRQDEKRAESPSSYPATAREQLVWCRTRAAAITAAKAEFGEKAFLRLLYEAVAPTAVKAYGFDDATADDLRFQERGCR